MKSIKFAILGVGMLCQTAATGLAQADTATEDFEFAYYPAFLESMAGRTEVMRDLKSEATRFCRANSYSLPHLNQERQCRQTLVEETLRRIAEQSPVGEELRTTYGKATASAFAR